MNNLGLLVDYIKQYELGLNQTMLDGDITEEYAYYFERLKEISILYPNFDYQRHLDKECSNAISYFYSNTIKDLEIREAKKIQQTLDFYSNKY
jgi:hypothetical protein